MITSETVTNGSTLHVPGAAGGGFILTYSELYEVCLDCLREVGTPCTSGAEESFRRVREGEGEGEGGGFTDGWMCGGEREACELQVGVWEGMSVLNSSLLVRYVS